MIPFLLPKSQPKPYYSVQNKEALPDKALVQINGLSGITGQIRDKLCKLFTWLAMCAGLYACFVAKTDAIALWVLAASIPWLCFPMTWWLFARLLGHRKTVIINKAEIVFSHGFRRISIPWDKPISFALKPHPYAELEANRYRFGVYDDRAKRKARYRKPFFQDSFQVCVVRHHVATKMLTVYDKRQAEACLAVLNAAKEEIEASLRIGKGVAADPNLEWSNQAGDL